LCAAIQISHSGIWSSLSQQIGGYTSPENGDFEAASQLFSAYAKVFHFFIAEWNQQFVLPVRDPQTSQLECTLWDDSDANVSKDLSFVNEFSLNIYFGNSRPFLPPVCETMCQDLLSACCGFADGRTRLCAE
jgi:hypothetical protein